MTRVDYVMQDFGGADTYFAGQGTTEWGDLDAVLGELIPHFHASDQRGKEGTPIFDPKGTNAALTAGARARGWNAVPVPNELTMFGVDWDGGKGSTLAEWQFSNYPFLWNNVIRTQAVVTGKVALANVGVTQALAVVTKRGLFPASNSTLYYEQARAQLEAVYKWGTFDLPVRLIGLSVPDNATEIAAVWSDYGDRYVRAHESRADIKLGVTWKARKGKYGEVGASFRPR